MRIVFLCGSLEHGRDGVGDYTRRLACELIKKGFQVALVALNDQHVKIAFDGEQYLDNITIPVLRLPATTKYKLRFEQAGVWMESFNPQWLSLQFVPFSFNEKGLVFGLHKLLKRFGNGRKWQIMVHELWVGMDKEASKKMVYWGWLQRQLIKNLISKLHPAIIHTQSNLYMQMLQKFGLKPLFLPLFGNIPFHLNNSNYQHNQHGDQHKNICFVVFGGIHHGVSVHSLAQELKEFSITTQKKIKLIMIGRCGSEQTLWENSWRSAGLEVEIMGEQSEIRISEILSNATFGISTTPAFLIEKSGSVAAMLEHGLPVLCISRAWTPRGQVALKIPKNVHLYQQGKIKDFITFNHTFHQVTNILSITDQFSNDLKVYG